MNDYLKDTLQIWSSPYCEATEDKIYNHTVDTVILFSILSSILSTDQIALTPFCCDFPFQNKTGQLF